MSAAGSVAVLIPTYLEQPASAGQLSSRQCSRILGDHPRVLVAPEGLSVQFYLDRDPDLHVERFPARYFESTFSYTELLLSKSFYQRFARYEYILIHQLDSLVLRDTLDSWCEAGYDYIGAPWFGNGIDELLRYLKPWWRRKPLTNGGGNGGLSLRKVSTHLRILSLFRLAVKRWGRLNEDVFWGMYVPSRLRSFRIPTERTAALFSLESQPRRFLELTGGDVPFGCHGWLSRDPAFWIGCLSAHDLVPDEDLIGFILEPLQEQVRRLAETIDQRSQTLVKWVEAVERREVAPRSETAAIDSLFHLRNFAIARKFLEAGS